MEVSQWLYYDSSKEQKGPIPTTVMLRLLEKGIGVSPETLVWKAGMAGWQRMAEVEEFKEKCEFISKMWYYLDANHQQKGPILSRMIVHKIRVGEVDGLTMMFSNGMAQWAVLSDIPELKKVAQDIAEEEAHAASLLSAIGTEDQTFSYEEDAIPRQAMEEMAAPKGGELKEFVNDEGIRHVWDVEMDGWVVAEEEEEDTEGTVGDDQASTGQKTSEFLKELDVDGQGPDGEGDSKPEKRKRNKKKKKTNNEWSSTSSLWVYVNNLPLDVTVDEVKAHFSKVGLIALNPVDQLPKIKMYLDESGAPKGDCSICYNAESSANMAVDVLDGGYLRPSSKPLSVTRAEFQKRSAPAGTDSSVDQPARKKQTLTAAQIKVSQNAMAQALAWNEDDDVGVSKSKALKIVVIEHMFNPLEVDEEFKGEDSAFFEELESDIAAEGEKCGQIDKITIFSRSPQGAVIIKFCTSYAAQECVRVFDGRMYGGRKLRCKFWDGVMDYTAVTVPSYEQQQEQQKQQQERAKAEAGGQVLASVEVVDAEESRLDAFGDWLDNEQDDLPEEFRLRVE